MQAKQNKCFRVSGMGSTHSLLLSPMTTVLRKCCQRIHMFCSPGSGPHPRPEIFISGVWLAEREERRNRIPRESESCRRILYPVNLAVAHSSPVSRETGHIKNLLRQRIEMKNLLVYIRQTTWHVYRYRKRPDKDPWWLRPLTFCALENIETSFRYTTGECRWILSPHNVNETFLRQVVNHFHYIPETGCFSPRKKTLQIRNAPVTFFTGYHFEYVEFCVRYHIDYISDEITFSDPIDLKPPA